MHRCRRLQSRRRRCRQHHRRPHQRHDAGDRRFPGLGAEVADKEGKDDCWKLPPSARREGQRIIVTGRDVIVSGRDVNVSGPDVLGYSAIIRSPAVTRKTQSVVISSLSNDKKCSCVKIIA